MRAIQKRVVDANRKISDKARHDTLHAPDGIHLTDLGQLAMAYAILKGLGAPAEVSAVEIDAAGRKLLRADGCQVTDLVVHDGTLEFTRLDAGLPFNYGVLYGLHYRSAPVPDGLNRYMLKVKGLADGKYEVLAGGRSTGVFTASQLAAGVNIASSTTDPWQPGGPWDAQAGVLKSLTDARHEVVMADVQARLNVPDSATAEQLAKQARAVDDRIVEMQRIVARPQPYRFIVKKHKETIRTKE
jgi:hypothetical protein